MWARINDGTVAEITDIDPKGRFHPSIEWVEFDGRTNIQIGWHYDGNEFTPPAGATLSEIAEIKRHAIDRAREAAIDAGFTHDFNGTQDVVQTRARDRENITGLAVSAQLMLTNGDTTSTLPFRAESDTTYQLTAQEIVDLAQAAQQHVSAQYAHAWELKDQIESALAAEDRAALEAISW
ncbi:protein of unknown function [Modicisalibacter ilicicola DSM 19980]|uniref:DUF4376 domain-containing protein n=1 Tax=Modicisalibacter ilicicola DSM 19980 TaxID=1121942 RepID=A0A1M4Y3I1_9GAMM|nr:DUF4376 domain-containing protein [Halomonas ilicicola]SHF00239.1 protein of unknown function [Halomonas ilicicola DSM 19980]